jgi:DNA-binding response OmpR family regulator
LRKNRILIVEDDLIVAKDLQMILKERGYEVIQIVFNPEQTIIKCREMKPDLVLMDTYVQGETDALEIARSIKAEFRIPVVYLTGEHENLSPGTAPCQEPNFYVKKPFSEDGLCRVIEAVLKDLRKQS